MTSKEIGPETRELFIAMELRGMDTYMLPFGILRFVSRSALQDIARFSERIKGQVDFTDPRLSSLRSTLNLATLSAVVQLQNYVEIDIGTLAHALFQAYVLIDPDYANTSRQDIRDVVSDALNNRYRSENCAKAEGIDHDFVLHILGLLDLPTRDPAEEEYAHDMLPFLGY